MKDRLIAAAAFVLTIVSVGYGADKTDKEIRGVISSISEPDGKGVVTITVMDGSRKDRRVVTLTVDANTKIVEKKKTRDIKALETREEISATGEQPATQIEILRHKVKREE